MVMDYEIKKGHAKIIEGDGLKNIVIEAFGKAEKKDDMIVSSYGAMTSLETKMKDRSTVIVNTTTDPKAAVEVAAETIKKYNAFLESATGFTSKERRTRLQKKAKEGKL
jgi:hypothetical protein